MQSRVVCYRRILFVWVVVRFRLGYVPFGFKSLGHYILEIHVSDLVSVYDDITPTSVAQLDGRTEYTPAHTIRENFVNEIGLADSFDCLNRRLERGAARRTFLRRSAPKRRRIVRGPKTRSRRARRVPIFEIAGQVADAAVSIRNGSGRFRRKSPCKRTLERRRADGCSTFLRSENRPRRPCRFSAIIVQTTSGTLAQRVVCRRFAKALDPTQQRGYRCIC